MSSVPVVTYSVRLVVLELRVEILGDEDLYVQVRMRRIMIKMIMMMMIMIKMMMMMMIMIMIMMMFRPGVR